MDEISKDDMRRWAVELVAIVEPDDVFVVQDGFDDIVANWHKARSQDEGKFIGGAEIASFAALVIPKNMEPRVILLHLAGGKLTDRGAARWSQKNVESGHPRADQWSPCSGPARAENDDSSRRG